LFYEETPGLGAKRFRAELDENPKSDVARYGLAIAQIKGGQLNEARKISSHCWPSRRTSSSITSLRSIWTSPTTACRTLNPS
jgi:predicted Zn-dependent protease